MNLSIKFILVTSLLIQCGQFINSQTTELYENTTTQTIFTNNSRKLIITEKNLGTVQLLEKYHFKLRDDCLFDLNQYYELDSSNNQHTDRNLSNELRSRFCPTTADFLLCFPTTPANQTIRFPCPYKDAIVLKDAFATRRCNPNGTWESSNYMVCIQKIIALIDNDTDESLYKTMANLYLIGFSITIVSVSLAIFIFISFRSLRCLRNMIHCNMLATFVLKCSTYIGFYGFVFNNSSLIWNQNHFMCILYNIFWNYSLLASFFWNMIEAVYLITVIVAAYSSNKIKLWWYLIIGWVLPMIPIIPYSILTYQSGNTTCSWIKHEYHSVNEMLIDVPIYIVLAINFILLIIILYVIIKKLRTNNDALKPKYIQYKKLTRATAVLFPLFGLTFAVFFWHPTDKNALFSKIYYGISIFLQTTQGIWVSFVYCFFNDEVKNALRAKFQSWKISYLGPRFFSMSRNPNQSNLTTQTYTTQTVTQSNFNTTSPQRLGTSVDPAIIPMMPLESEDKQER